MRNKKTNEEVEPTLKVLMAYGYSRDFIISKIFDGYFNENLGTDNEVKENFLNKKYSIFKAPFINDKIQKERIIILKKEETFFPLFIDINHSLYFKKPEKVISSEKLESIFKDIFLKNILK